MRVRRHLLLPVNTGGSHGSGNPADVGARCFTCSLCICLRDRYFVHRYRSSTRTNFGGMRPCSYWDCQTAGGVGPWAHGPVNMQETADPPVLADTTTKLLLRSKKPFWMVINNDVKQHGPLPPIKVFKHGIQSLYSKTKGGVDGSAQARAILRSPTSSLRWEQKLVIQTIKTLAVNAFTSYRLQCKSKYLGSQEDFGSLNSFRASLNSVQSLADFIFDVSEEILEHADILQRASTRDASMSHALTDSMSGAVTSRLSSLGKSRKRKRLLFFNEEDGINLRIRSSPHRQKQVKEHLYCALCGINRKHSSAPETHAGPVQALPTFRGHRTSFKCDLCHVHLCIRIYPGLRKSCWELWHSKAQLEPRETPPPSTSASKASMLAAVNGDETDDEPVSTPSTRTRRAVTRSMGT